MPSSDRQHRPATSFDVARLAGVSRSAVSRAFTPGATISEETRKKVISAAAQLGYRVNSLARGLQTTNSGIVGLVASRLDTPLRSREVRLLSTALIREGFRPMLLTADEADDVGGLIGSLLGYSVAGIIVTSDTPPQEIVDDCGRLGLPLVLINRAATVGWGDRVIIDGATAGALALKMLTERGADRLACLAPQTATYTVNGRANAFLAMAETRRLSCTMICSVDQSYQEARRAICIAGDRLLGVDGLFCATDLMALGALDGLRLDLGLSVPKDLQVLGFDDIEQASWGSYNLSTIRQDLEAQTEQAIRLLLERIEEDAGPPRTITLPLTEIHRGTTR